MRPESSPTAILLDLRELRGSETRIDRTCPPTAFASEATDEYRVVDDVVLALRVRKDGEKYRVVGRLKTCVELSCCRCLEPFEAAREIAVDLLYLPQSANQGDVETEISEEDLSTAFYRDDQINLVAMAREQLQLAVPMKPLCRETCRGLCSMCGTNLNVDRCSCDTVWRDPRLAALDRWRPRRPSHESRRFRD